MNKYRILSVGVLVIMFVLLTGGNALIAQTAQRCIVIKCSPQQQPADCCPQAQSAKDCQVDTKSADCCPGGTQSPNCCPAENDGSKSSQKTQPSKNSQRLNSTAEKSPDKEIVKPAKSGS